MEKLSEIKANHIIIYYYQKRKNELKWLSSWGLGKTTVEKMKLCICNIKNNNIIVKSGVVDVKETIKMKRNLDRNCNGQNH